MARLSVDKPLREEIRSMIRTIVKKQSRCRILSCGGVVEFDKRGVGTCKKCSQSHFYPLMALRSNK